MAIYSTGPLPAQDEGSNSTSSTSSPSTEPDVREALSSTQLRCLECSALYPAIGSGASLASFARYRCDCGGVLDVEMSLSLPTGYAEQVTPGQDELLSGTKTDALPAVGAAWRQLFDERITAPPLWSIGTDTHLLDASGVWRYRELLLPAPDRYVVSRPEGNTSLYPVGSENCSSASRAGHRHIGLYAGLEHLFLKHEGENPTGSFKDRGMTVGVTMAKMLGAQAVACASTGNTSASLASYAAQAGMRGLVFLPAGNVAGGKLAQTLAYGATTIQIEGNFDDAMRLVEQVCNEQGIYLLNSLNPFRIEGQKAIGFEILHQLDWRAPDWIVLPAGNLGNTSALGKAFRQAYQLGIIDSMPRFAAIQAEGANPFYRSYTAKFADLYPVQQPHTVATAIKIGNPVSHKRARRVIEETDGVVVSVSDEQILAAKAVIDRSGIGCEPASAATLAGIRQLVEGGIIKRGERVVGILTGNLLKDTITGIPQGRERSSSPVIQPTIEAVRSVLSV